MLKKKKTLLLIIIISSLTAWYPLKKAYFVSRYTHTIGTVKAISAALYTEEERNPQLINDLSGSVEDGWQRLSDEVYDEVITIIGQHYNLDAPRDWEPFMPLKDMWGRRFIILFQQVSGATRFVVISAGPDSIYNTSDDIVSEKLKAVKSL